MERTFFQDTTAYSETYNDILLFSFCEHFLVNVWSRYFWLTYTFAWRVFLAPQEHPIQQCVFAKSHEISPLGIEPKP